ncbi:MAG: hypothetical protein KA777_12965 [Rhodoferax sp.]|nr:hypothetical protein [Rhodoferax sp.]MBP7574882.1 hypothetical protein [Rhodoferax sp.]
MFDGYEKSQKFIVTVHARTTATLTLMRDWAFSGGAKIERAKEHVADFERASRAFLDAHRYSAVSRYDPKRKELAFFVEGTHIVPARLASITADAIHNLRASLDILWHQAWSKGNSGKRKQYFPLVRNARELEARFKTIKQTEQKAAVDILRAIKPFELWNKLLALNEIDARDKHELPVLAAATYKQVIMKLPPDVLFQGKTGLQVVAQIGSGFLFLECGTQLPIVTAIETDTGPVTHMECDLTADIAFGPGEFLEGELVLKTLRESVEIIDDIAQAFLTVGLIR